MRGPKGFLLWGKQDPISGRYTGPMSESNAAPAADPQTVVERLRHGGWRDRAADPLDGEPLVPAAVLVPLVRRPGGLRVVLTRRTDHLRAHAGQISFPGGRIEAGDACARAAALREAEEEIGLAPSQVEVLATLPRYRTGTGFLITPLAGLVAAEAVFRADPFEVAEVFEVPLAFAVDPANHQPMEYQTSTHRYLLYSIYYGNYFIWGATAGMLRDLGRLLAGLPVEPQEAQLLPPRRHGGGSP